MKYVNTTNQSVHVMTTPERVVAPGEVIESEVELTGPFAPENTERKTPAVPEEVS